MLCLVVFIICSKNIWKINGKKDINLIAKCRAYFLNDDHNYFRTNLFLNFPILKFDEENKSL